MLKTTVALILAAVICVAGSVEAKFPYVKQMRIIERTPGTEFYYVDACVDANNQVHVIWSQTTLETPDNDHLYYRRYNNLGESTCEIFEFTRPGWDLWGQPSIYCNDGAMVVVTCVLHEIATNLEEWTVWYSNDGSGSFDTTIQYGIDMPYTWKRGHAGIGLNTAGRSAIAWKNSEIDNGFSTYYEVRDEQHQKIDSTRATRSGEFYYQNARHNRVAMDPSGRFVVVWEANHGPDQTWIFDWGFLDSQITARIFDMNGNPLTGEIYVDCEGFPQTCSGDTSTFFEGKAAGHYPDIAMQANGDFAVIYIRSYSYDCQKEYYCLRRFYADGTPKGPNIQVNDQTECYAYSKASRIFSDPVGNLLVVWTNNNLAGDWSQWNNIYAQRFDSLGNKVGVNYRLNDISMTSSSGMWEIFGAGMNENGLVAIATDEHNLLGPGVWITLQTMDVHDIGRFVAGDANRDYMINISDAVFLISYIFAGGIAPIEPCLGDPDGNGMINISDAVSLINYIFLGGQVVGECP